MLHSEYHPLRRVSLWSLLVPTPYELFESLQTTYRIGTVALSVLMTLSPRASGVLLTA